MMPKAPLHIELHRVMRRDYILKLGKSGNDAQMEEYFLTREQALLIARAVLGTTDEPVVLSGGNNGH